jgi:hypothetical protein
MYLGNLQLDVTFGTAHDLAFFDFVFVEIDFGVTLRTSGHGFLSFPAANLYQRAYYIPLLSSIRIGDAQR